MAISASDRRADLKYAATIHQGIPLDEFTFCASRGSYRLFFGRIHPEKGASEAIDVARRTGHKLILAGIVQDGEYFRTAVAPFLDGQQIRYIERRALSRRLLARRTMHETRRERRPPTFGVKIMNDGRPRA